MILFHYRLRSSQYLPLYLQCTVQLICMSGNNLVMNLALEGTLEIIYLKLKSHVKYLYSEAQRSEITLPISYNALTEFLGLKSNVRYIRHML